MASRVLKKPSFQESFKELELDENQEVELRHTEKILLGKMMSHRPFKRYTLTEIIKHIWKTKGKVLVEKIAENTFKFTFESKVDRDFVFHNRPWSLNGSHLVLKIWPEDVILEDISFDKSTFYIQIHGLPPKLLLESNARKIGARIGDVVEFEGKMVVAHRYLRTRVDIPILEPLPAGFLQEKSNGDQFWVQFKLEKLADFCYRCGLITHVTGQCNQSFHEVITLKNGKVAKMYGPWLYAEKKASIQFDEASSEMAEQSLPERSEGSVDGTDTGLNAPMPSNRPGLIGWKRGPDDSLGVGNVAVGGSSGMSFLPASPTDLHITLKRQLVGEREAITKVIVKDVGGVDVSGAKLVNWASELMAVVDPSVVGPKDLRLLAGHPQAQNNETSSKAFDTDVNSEMGTSSQIGPETVETNGDALCNVTEESVIPLQTTPASPLVQEGDNSGFHEGASDDFRMRRESSQRRYQTRESNRNRSWKKAARARGGAELEGKRFKGESSKPTSLPSQPQQQDFH